MRCPSLNELPPPPVGKTGWPWTEQCPQLPEKLADGREWPRITIVTASYNQGQFIEETIRSVLLQGYPNIEYIILDGGSIDQTVDVIKKYDFWIAFWRSGPDDGQAAAINEGLKISTGTWFQNINSDDILAPSALAQVGNAPPNADLLYGDVLEFGAHTHLVHNSRPCVEDLIRPLSRTRTVAWHQPGVFLKRENMIALSGYDATYGYVFDFILTARYVEQFQISHRIEAVLVWFRIHNEAKSTAWRDRYLLESIDARDQLAKQLVQPSHKKLAKREADRRRVIMNIGRISDGDPNLNLGPDVIRTIRKHPTLALDRMFLGSVRRHPSYWCKAVIRTFLSLTW